MRLNKYISTHSSLSRREADEAIKDGKVAIKNVTVRDFIDVDEDTNVYLNGNLLKPKGENLLTVLIYHKPKGELVTKRDDRERRTIYKSIPNRFKSFKPIGRLDMASTGLLLLTDNNKMLNAFMHGTLERTYILKLSGKISEACKKAMDEGIHIVGKKGAHEKTKMDEITIKPFKKYYILKEGNYSKIKVTLEEGQNRELRRFFGHFDLDVMDLHRVSFGDINLDNLKEGKNRFATRKEYDYIKGVIRKSEGKKEKSDKKKYYR